MFIIMYKLNYKLNYAFYEWLCGNILFTVSFVAEMWAVQVHYFLWQLTPLLHSDCHALQQAAQNLPLSRFAMNRDPHILV